MSQGGDYDIIVVGAGHAGCEAAAAASAMGLRTCLLTIHLDTIAQMSCNPAVGGLAKGHLVREIDALGGLMGLLADETGIQFRLLNRSRGGAIRRGYFFGSRRSRIPAKRTANHYPSVRRKAVRFVFRRRRVYGRNDTGAH